MSEVGNRFDSGTPPLNEGIEMTTCIIIGLLAACSGIPPTTPEEAIKVFAASATRLPTVQAPPMGGSYLPPPMLKPVQTLVHPSSHWTSVTTWTPRYGPPITVFDLGLYQPRGRRR